MAQQQTFRYTANDAWPEPPAMRTGIYIKQGQNPDVRGVRRSVGQIGALTDKSKFPWIEVPHKPGDKEAIGEARNDANNNTWGIFTRGQFNCVCIIVAVLGKEDGSKWSQAWLTHVSSQYSSEVNQMVDKLTAENCAKAYVAIGGKRGSLGTMEKIGRAFGGIEVPEERKNPPPAKTPYPNPVFKPVTVVIYAGGADDEPFNFGLSKDGEVGEVTGQM